MSDALEDELEIALSALRGREQELEAMRPVVEAAKRWSKFVNYASERAESVALMAAVKTYRETFVGRSYEEQSFATSDAYVLIRRRGGWSISCAACGGYHVHKEPGSADTIEEILDLHGCGEPPL